MVITKETWRNTVCNAFHKHTALWLLFYVSNVVCLYDLHTIKSEYENKEKKIILMIFYDSRYLNHFKDVRNMRDSSKYPSKFPYSKHLQAIDLSFATFAKPLSNKIEETFHEILKWKCKPFDLNGWKDF